MGDGSRWVPEVVAERFVPIYSDYEGECVEVSDLEATSFVMTEALSAPSLKLTIVRSKVTGSKELLFEIRARQMTVQGWVQSHPFNLNKTRGINEAQIEHIAKALFERFQQGAAR